MYPGLFCLFVRCRTEFITRAAKLYPVRYQDIGDYTEESHHE